MKLIFSQIKLGANNVVVCDIPIDTTNPGFLQTTIDYRINILKEALTGINIYINTRHANQYLNVRAILTAPEYFFAAGNIPGKTRQYSEQIKDQILAEIAEFSRLNPYVLIIPGTIAWMQSHVTGNLTMEEDEKYAGVVHEEEQLPADQLKKFQESQSRGEGSNIKKFVESQSKSNAVLKASDGIVQSHYYTLINKMRYGSNTITGAAPNDTTTKLIYLLPIAEKIITSTPPSSSLSLAYNSAYVYLGGNQLYRYDKQSDYEENLSQNSSVIFANGSKSSVINIPTSDRGSSFNLGIEICLDHCCGVLKDELANDSLMGEGLLSKIPDIHLILSATVGNKGEHVCLKNRGYLIHSSSASTNRRYQEAINGELVNLKADVIILTPQVASGALIPAPAGSHVAIGDLINKVVTNLTNIGFVGNGQHYTHVSITSLGKNLNIPVKYFSTALNSIAGGNFKLLELANDHITIKSKNNTITTLDPKEVIRAAMTSYHRDAQTKKIANSGQSSVLFL